MSDSELNDSYETNKINLVNTEGQSYRNVQTILQNSERVSESGDSCTDKTYGFSFVPSEETNGQVSQLCGTVRTALMCSTQFVAPVTCISSEGKIARTCKSL